MSFKPVQRGESTVGYAFETPTAYFFFGTRNTTRENLPQFFPEYTFAYLKQVHGKTVVPADPLRQLEADGHFTRQKNLALVSQTADCVPVLLANDQMVCAIHSGWKGTALNIIATSNHLYPTHAAIGPHILDFEVGHDVAAQLLRAAPRQSNLLKPHADPAKTYFDLTSLIRRQLRETHGPLLEVHEYLADTIKDLRFHSFRRDKATAGRQYSFVVLKA